MRNARIAFAAIALALIGACAAFTPPDADSPSPFVVRMAQAVADAQEAVEATPAGSDARKAAERNLEAYEAALGILVVGEEFNEAVRDDQGRVDPAKVIEVGAGTAAPFLPPPWNLILAGVGGIAGTVAGNRKGKSDGAAEVARAIQQARNALPEFDDQFTGKAGDILKSAPISETARKAVRKAKAGG